MIQDNVSISSSVVSSSEVLPRPLYLPRPQYELWHTRVRAQYDWPDSERLVAVTEDGIRVSLPYADWVAPRLHPKPVGKRWRA